MQYQTQSYFLSGQVKELICDPLVKYSFYVFLNQQDDFSNSMRTKTCADLTQLLYLYRLQDELRRANKLSALPSDPSLPLLRSFLTAPSPAPLKTQLASVALLCSHWTLLDPSTSGLLPSLSSILFKQTRTITLASQHQPRFVTFILQNLNHLSLP